MFVFVVQSRVLFFVVSFVFAPVDGSLDSTVDREVDVSYNVLLRHVADHDHGYAALPLMSPHSDTRAN